MRGVWNRAGIGDKGDLYENRTNVLDNWEKLRYNINVQNNGTGFYVITFENIRIEFSGCVGQAGAFSADKNKNERIFL